MGKLWSIMVTTDHFSMTPGSWVAPWVMDLLKVSL